MIRFYDLTIFLGFDTPLMGRRARYGVGLRQFRPNKGLLMFFHAGCFPFF